MSSRFTCAALAAVSTLALSACSFNLTLPTGEPTGDGPVKPPGFADEMTPTEAPANMVDPQRFVAEGHVYLVGLDGTGSRGCIIPIDGASLSPFHCDLAFPEPTPLSPTGLPANMVSYDPVYGIYPDHMEPGEADALWGRKKEQLAPGESVDLGGYLISRTTEDTFTVERGAHVAVIMGGEMGADTGTELHTSTPFQNGEQAKEGSEGSWCGTVSTGYGAELQVIAVENATNCMRALDVAAAYTSGDPALAVPEGSANVWASDDGWTCATSYLPPGYSDELINFYPLCRAMGLEEGAGGSVVLLDRALLER